MLPPYLDEADVDAFITRALEEDVADGDVTTLATIPEGRRARATLIAKEGGVLAGALVAERVFARLAPEAVFRWNAVDGDTVGLGDRVLELEASARGVLTAERTALNFLQRMSGIATATRRMVEAVHPHRAQVLDTRKTAPGLRRLDKWAVAIGGGANHRIGLFDMILIKENHIAAAGGIESAIEAAREWISGKSSLSIEIEVRTLDELREVLRVGGAEVVLLDNMVRRAATGWDASLLAEAVDFVGGRYKTEASGNVTLDSIPVIAATGVDYISSGALTHSVQALDVSLIVELD